LKDFDTDKYCSKCKVNLSATSNFCPQCGWPKNKHMVPYEDDKEKVANNIESNPSPKEPTGIKFKNEIYRPTGVRILGIFHMVFGIVLVAMAILSGAAVVFLVMMSAMSGLAGIADIGIMPIPLGMDDIDPAMLSSLDMISELPGIEGLGSASEIEGLTNSAGVMSMEVIMAVMVEAILSAIFLILLGIITFVIGRGLLRGKKWARILTIVLGIISIPFVALYVGILDNLILIGLVAIEGLIVFYMFRPRVREFFIQTSIKNSIKNSKIET